MPKAKSLETKRAEALARLQKDEADQHAIFKACLYPRQAWDVCHIENVPEEVTIMSYGFDPNSDAVIPTILVRNKDCRTFRCSIDMIHLTKEEAWNDIVNGLQEGIRDAQKALLEQTQNLVNMQLQLDNARALAHPDEHGTLSS